ncbi:MAG: malate dehydrogenase [Acidobacteria bacterium]|nr:malate dehydrogenase [Acidobacteriota bacterium]
MKQVSIIGSGNVGANCAFFIAENRAASVTLVDVRKGLSTGKALDISEAGPIRHYNTKIRGSDDIEAIRNSDIVVIAAGRVRRPDESREDLYSDNIQSLPRICADIREFAPDAVVINVIEPVDRTTLLAQSLLGFDRKRILGIGGLLSSTRLRYMVSNSLGVSPREVTAIVIGPHTPEMVILRNTVRVSGIPADKLLSPELFDSIIAEVREADETILYMAQHSTAFYAPSAAIASLADAILRDTKAILPVSIKLEGEYGLNNIAVSVPVRIGAGGAECVIPVEMSDSEREAFRSAAAALRSSLDRAGGWTDRTGGARNA